jgi:Protein of unknown function (DUF4229)
LPCGTPAAGGLGFRQIDRLSERAHHQEDGHGHPDGNEDHGDGELLLAHPVNVGHRAGLRLAFVREFIVYTLLRVGMFLGSLAIVSGIWALLSPDNSVPVVWAVVIAFAVSGLASYKLLNAQREALARNVQTRAERASAKFEEMKAREDTPE